MKTHLEKIENLSFAMAEGSRGLMVSAIIENAGDEIETVPQAIELAAKTDQQLRYTLHSILQYYINEIILLGEEK